VISPYSVAHGVSHVPSEHSSIIKFVDELFGLIPLADLPDEMRARQIGADKFGQPNLGPADDKVPGVGDMSVGLRHAAAARQAPAAERGVRTIPAAEIASFPHAGGAGCKQLEIKPTDSGLPNPVPADFNPRPDTTPGIPTAGGWTP
jgi:phospholipase C